MNNESVMTEETSKQDFVDNGLPSFNEATKEDKEKNIDQHEDSAMKEVPLSELVNKSVPDGTQYEIEQNVSEDITEEISSEQMEIKENKTEKATSEVKDETKETGEIRPKEKKSRFRFSMFSNEKR